MAYATFQEINHMTGPLQTLVAKKQPLDINQVLILLTLFLSVSSGRWGSWIGIPGTPFYLIDFLLISAALSSLPDAARRKSLYFGSFGFILLFTILQYLSSGNASTVTKIRDLAPFLYLLLIPLLAVSLSNIDIRTIFLCLRYATLINAIWSFGIATNLIHPIVLGGPFQVPLFSPRWDQTGMALAIGLIVWSGSERKNLRKSIPVIIFLILTAFLQSSRASILAFAFASLFVLLRAKNRSKSQFTRFIVVFGVVLAAFLMQPKINLLLPQNSAVGKFSSQFTDLRQSNTVSARLNAQILILEYWKDSGKIMFGLGPGDEMVINSSAVLYLSGSPDVRAPHSWIVGLLARYGLVGFFLWSLWPVKLLLTRMRSSNFTNEVKVMVIAILICSFFGVIIESPFGSIPFCIFLAFILMERDKCRK